MSGSVLSSPAILAVVAIPRTVIWAYAAFAAILVIGVAAIFIRGDWEKARGFDKLILFGVLFYAAPLAGFGTEHFTLTKDVASLIPALIPWHMFWAYFVGACFIAGPVSLATKIQEWPAASLLAVTFFLFVLLMDLPGWLHNPKDRFGLALVLRELSFSGGALALAASLTEHWHEHGAHFFATIARYFIAIGVVFYSFEQFLHADYVPGIPLNRVTPEWVHGHAFWTYLAAAIYAVAGVLLLIGKQPRAAAMAVGLTVLLLVLAVYVPIAVVERGSIVGFNFLGDTLMYGGAVLMLAGAMPREVRRREA